MTTRSEIRLMQELLLHDYRLMRAPSSGTGIKHPETGDRIDTPDVLALKYIDGDGGLYSGRLQVLCIEEKSAQYPIRITDRQVQSLREYAADIDGEALIAFHKPNTQYPHDFLAVSDLEPAGDSWKIEPGVNGPDSAVAKSFSEVVA